MFGKDKNQKSREKVLYEGQPNIIVYNTSVLWALIVLGFLFTLYGQGVAAIGNMQVYAISSVKQPLTTYFAIAILVLIIVTFLFIAIKLLSWTSVKYTITESRVIVEKGIIFNKQNSMPFNTIQDVSRTQSIIGRILSVGSIELYSAYDGKNLKIEDISSPKKVEDLIFENLRGTHLRTPVDYDNGYSNDFAPAEPGHYRRMEDLDDLTLVNAKEQKKMQREIRRQARRNKYRREHPKYGSQDGYDTKYGQGYNQQYAPDYDSGYYEGNSGYRQNSNRDMNYNPHYGKSHRGSGAIRESYRQNPDKYFADNYEEFHQNNLDARDNYENQSYGGSNYSAPRQGSSTRSYRPSQSYDNGYGRSREDYRSNDDYGSPDAYSRGNQNQNQEKPQSKGAVERIKSFNLFGNSNESEKDISDREFDEAIDQAMQNMEGSIKFQPIANMKRCLRMSMQGIQIIKALMITSTPIPEAPNLITIQKDMIIGMAITETLVIMLMRAITELIMNIILKEEVTEIPNLIMEVTESQIIIKMVIGIPIIMKIIMEVQTIINQAVMNLASLRMRKTRMIFLQNILKSLENINLFYSIFFNQGSLI